MITKNCEKRMDNIYKAEGFENQFEKTKRTGLELILSVQSFTIEPSKKKMATIHDKVADYWLLCKQILRNASKVELKYLVRLNKSFEKTINDLDLKEVYSNILHKYDNEIQSRLEEKVRSLSIEFKEDPYKLGMI